MISLNILKSSLLQANKLVITYKNMEAKMVLFYFLRQDIAIELHIIQTLKKFALQVDKAGAAI